MSTHLTLYDNGFRNGFRDGSFSYRSRNQCDGATFTSAPCSYAIAYNGWGALGILPAGSEFSTAPYAWLEWNLNTSGRRIDDFSVLFTDTGGKVIAEVRLSPANVTAALPNGWVHVSVPLSHLNPSNLPVGSIQLKNALNAELPMVYIDDIRLVTR